MPRLAPLNVRRSPQLSPAIRRRGPRTTATPQELYDLRSKLGQIAELLGVQGDGPMWGDLVVARIKELRAAEHRLDEARQDAYDCRAELDQLDGLLDTSGFMSRERRVNELLDLERLLLRASDYCRVHGRHMLAGGLDLALDGERSFEAALRRVVG